jgi:hypothetical protein
MGSFPKRNPRAPFPKKASSGTGGNGSARTGVVGADRRLGRVLPIIFLAPLLPDVKEVSTRRRPHRFVPPGISRDTFDAGWRPHAETSQRPTREVRGPNGLSANADPIWGNVRGHMHLARRPDPGVHPCRRTAGRRHRGRPGVAARPAPDGPSRPCRSLARRSHHARDDHPSGRVRVSPRVGAPNGQVDFRGNHA